MAIKRAYPTWRSSFGFINERSRRRVLVVDDDPSLLTFVAILLEEDYKVITAVDGFDALAKLLEAVPDIVVLDLEMPRMNGRTFYREMRRRGIDSPVIVLSAFGADEAQVELGAQAHVNKPFQPDRLLEVVSGLISH